ncbi:MAG: DUF1206 domain-containing protein [Blautia sp.]|nr:DUF1206 domain-containing protein [Blautia sp.]
MKQPKSNIGNSQREEFYTPELKILKNVFIFNETIIPLYNISQINIVKGSKKPYSLIHFILVLAGIGCLLSRDILLGIIGLVLICLGVWFIYEVYEENHAKDEFLVLGLNSGKDVCLYSNNHAFTVEILNVIINCINSGKEYIINMENCKIEKCQFGERNTLYDKGDKTVCK